MVYQLDRILKDVRIALDQNGANETLLSEEDESTLSLDELIRSKVLEAVDRVHSMAPYYKLELGHNMNNGNVLFWEGNDTCGWVLLPDDFMRLVVFQMSDWERVVYNPIYTDDPSYPIQRGRVKGLRGTAQRPVCVIAMRPSGNVLEFYSCKSNQAEISKAVYIPYASIDEDGGVDISERCYESVVYTIGALTLMSCGEVEKGSSLLEIAKGNIEK